MATERDNYSVWFGAKDKMSGPLKKMGGAVATFAASFLALSAAKNILRDSIAAAAETQAAYSALATAIERSGAVWDDTQGAIRRFTGSMQELTGVADETFAKGVQMFVNYGFTAAEAFRLVRVATDVSIAQNEDLIGQFKFFAEAAGNSADSLKKYGATMTAGASNATRFAEAIGQIEARFTGSAEAKRDTAVVQYQSMTQAWGDFLEKVGEFAVSAGAVDALKSLTDAINTARVAFFGTDDKVEELSIHLESLESRASNLLSTIRAQETGGGGVFGAMADALGITSEQLAENRQRYAAIVLEIGRLKSELKAAQAAEEEALKKVGTSGEAVAARTRMILADQRQMMRDLIRGVGEAEVRMLKLTEGTESIGPAIDSFGPPTPTGILVARLLGEDGGEAATKELSRFQEGAIAVWNTGVARFSDGLLQAFGGARVRMGDIFKGMANDFISLFIEEAIQALVGRFVVKALTALALFDKEQNDRFAMSQGADYAKYFTQGAMNVLNKGAIATSVSMGGGLVPAIAGAGGPTNEYNFNFGSVMTDDSVARSLARRIEKFSKLGTTAIVTRNIKGRI